jgi:hypothetical protein
MIYSTYMTYILPINIVALIHRHLYIRILDLLYYKLKESTNYVTDFLVLFVHVQHMAWFLLPRILYNLL